VRDVGPNLSPDEELGDLAAAEAAVNAKDAERSEVVDEIREKLRGAQNMFLVSVDLNHNASSP